MTEKKDDITKQIVNLLEELYSTHKNLICDFVNNRLKITDLDSSLITDKLGTTCGLGILNTILEKIGQKRVKCYYLNSADKLEDSCNNILYTCKLEGFRVE